MPLSPRLTELLKTFEEAVVEYNNSGGGDPADMAEIKYEYVEAKRQLRGYLAFIEELAGDGRWVPGGDLMNLMDDKE